MPPSDFNPQSIYDSVVRDLGDPYAVPAPPKKTPAQIRRAKKRVTKLANEVVREQ